MAIQSVNKKFGMEEIVREPSILKKIRFCLIVFGILCCVLAIAAFTGGCVAAYQASLSEEGLELNNLEEIDFFIELPFDRILVEKANIKLKGLAFDPEKFFLGTVVGIGSGSRNQIGQYIPIIFAIGDSVLLEYGGKKIMLDSKEHFIHREQDVLFRWREYKEESQESQTN